MVPGAEFRAAALEADAMDAMICLGDRPVHITIARVWAALSAWEKVKFIFMMIHSGFSVPDAEEMRKLIEELKETDALTEVRPPPLSHPHSTR